MPMQFGQGSGDYRETSARVQILHLGIRNTIGLLTPDAFTQANPPVVTTAGYKSSTLSGITKVGVLGATVAFTRPDIGNGYIGGPVLDGSNNYIAGVKPLGIFINDAIGNPFENTPGPASGHGPFICGSGAVIAVSLWETKLQISGTPGNGLSWAAGDRVYAGVNGLLTNVLAEAYEYRVSGQNDADFVRVLGTVLIAPDASNSLMVIQLS